jgi:hypothetical protein
LILFQFPNVAHTCRQVNESPEADDDDDDTPLNILSTSSYLKMLQSIRELTLFRQNEDEFRILGESLRRVQLSLVHEQAENMKVTFITQFFHPNTPIQPPDHTNREESDGRDEDNEDNEPMVISDDD